MTNRFFQPVCFLAVMLATGLTWPLGAAENSETKLPYGANDVLKLSRAKVSDEIIVNYVQSSGTIYNLQPNDIVYLKEQGVSDKVLNTMLDQKKKVVETANAATAATTAPPPAPTAPTSPPAPVYAQPAETVVTPAAASTVYVIPYSPTTYPSYYSSYCYGYPYSYSYYSYPYYWGPSVSFGVRFGGYGGHYYGRYGGGYYAGGHFGGRPGSHWGGRR